MKTKSPKVPQITPQEKAREMLRRAPYDGALKDVQQILYLIEDGQNKKYWESVEGFVISFMKEKKPW